MVQSNHFFDQKKESSFYPTQLRANYFIDQYYRRISDTQFEQTACGNLTSCALCTQSNHCSWCYLQATCMPSTSVKEFCKKDVIVNVEYACSNPQIQICQEKTKCSSCVDDKSCVWIEKGSINGIKAKDFCWTGSVWHVQYENIKLSVPIQINFNQTTPLNQSSIHIKADEFFWGTCDLNATNFLVVAFGVPAIVIVLILVTLFAYIVYDTKRRRGVFTFDDWWVNSSKSDQVLGSTTYGATENTRVADNWDSYVDNERDEFVSTHERKMEQQALLRQQQETEERRRKLRARHKQKPIL